VERSVVAVHALVASGKLNKEEHAHSIQPRLWLRPVNFKTAAVRTAVQSNSTHRNTDEDLGREERYRTVISGMEPRRIAVVMLLPRRRFHYLTSSWARSPNGGNINRSKSCAPRLPIHARATRNKDACSKVRVLNCGGSYRWQGSASVPGMLPAYRRVPESAEPIGILLRNPNSLLTTMTL
jgi:hypothetical protein